MRIADGERIGLKRIKNKMEAPPFGLPPFYFYMFAFILSSAPEVLFQQLALCLLLLQCECHWRPTE